MPTEPIPVYGPEDLLGNFSLEMTGKDTQALIEAAELIPPGSRINVTFLASEDLETRVEAARLVKELGFVPVPHLSARRISSEEELEDILGRLQEVDASEHVFCVAGDPPEPAGPYDDAITLMRSPLLARYGVREVSFAGYPEGHPTISDELLWAHLYDKAVVLETAGLYAQIITQFSFDAEAVHTWIRQVREFGISAPIRVGTPGPAGVRRLLNYARRFGVGSSAGIVWKYGFSLTNLMSTAGPDKFVDRLGTLLTDPPNAGPVGIHLYTFGGLAATAEWASEYEAGR